MSADLLLENARLRSKIAELQSALKRRSIDGGSDVETEAAQHPPSQHQQQYSHGSVLDNGSLLRYSRHLLCSDLGTRPVLLHSALRAARVVVIGAGGLGCPALQYLAAAGVGRLTVVDDDVVDASNLPRQTLYSLQDVGRGKAETAARRLSQLNADCDVTAHSVRLSAGNAESLVRGSCVLLDCSDNAATRYLCNDVCLLLGIPCVSGSALRLEGQLTVYGWRDGPCYRCLFPQPPPASLTANCNEAGVLNAVTGCIGTLQAAEAVKLIALQLQEEEADHAAAFSCPALSVLSGRLLLVDAASSSFRTVKLRARLPDCAVCSPQHRSSIDLHRLQEQQEQPTCSSGVPASDAEQRSSELSSSLPSVSASALSAAVQNALSAASSAPFLLLDVRPSAHFDLCHLPLAVNVPLAALSQRLAEVEAAATEAADRARTETAEVRPVVYCICRRGVDSVQAVRLLQQHSQSRLQVFDVAGGLMAWRQQVDACWPLY